MLSELGKLQESSESVWYSNLSISIETRSEESDELVHKEYTFSYAEEWDKWTFREYEEKRTPDVDIGDRDWRRTRNVYWSDADAPDVDVPPEVSRQLEELLDADEVVLQK